MQQVKAIADTGCKVIVTGGKVGDLYLHFCNMFGLMVVRLPSKWDLRRLCKATGATALPRLVNIIIIFIKNRKFFMCKFTYNEQPDYL